MNAESTPAPATLLSLALSFYRDPLSFQDLLQGRSSLPAGVEVILQAASAGPNPPGSAGADAEERRKAAVFFIEQVLFAPHADYYRLLGLTPHEATDAKLREHYRLLMRLFHPDRRVSPDDWQAAYAGRVTQAYHVLRQPQARRDYDALRSAAPGIAEIPWRPPVRPPRHPPVQAAARWRRHLPQYVLTGMALAAGLFVLQVHLSHGLRTFRTVVPPVPGTPPPTTAESVVAEPPTAGRPPQQALDQALATDTRLKPSRLPPPTAVVTPPRPEAAAPALARGQVFPPAAVDNSSLVASNTAAQVTTVHAPAVPALAARPADNPAPPLRLEERNPKPAVRPAAAASTITALPTSPTLSPPAAVARPAESARVAPPPPAPVARPAESARVAPPPPAPVARPAESARVAPAPISPAESSALLGRFIAAYNQGDLGAMRALFGAGDPALNQYRDLFSRTASRQLAVTGFSWRFTGSGALGRGGLSLRLRYQGPVPDQSYTGSLELELGRQKGGQVYIRRINHVLRTGPAPASPRPPERDDGNG